MTWFHDSIQLQSPITFGRMMNIETETCACGASFLWVRIATGFLKVDAEPVEDGELVVWIRNGTLYGEGHKSKHGTERNRYRNHNPRCPDLRRYVGPTYRPQYSFD